MRKTIRSMYIQANIVGTDNTWAMCYLSAWGQFIEKLPSSFTISVMLFNYIYFHFMLL